MTAFASPEDHAPLDHAETRRPLTVALVNNMPDPALAATERQFRRLVERHSGPDVEFRVFHIPAIARSEAGAAFCKARYQPLDCLLREPVDALIVSGCEPGRGPLSAEPFWPDFVRLVDWARENTTSTLWSCLAAHAALLHLDGIERRRFPQKLFGVFACREQGTHPLLAGGSDPVLVPHSRFNGVSESDLGRHGYRVLTGSDATGPDMAVKLAPSLFVFLQGHPEYDADSLHREFRRDVGRYLSGMRDDVPALPVGLFGDDTRRAVSSFAAAAAAARHPERLKALPLLPVAEPSAWQASTDGLYRNWLGWVRASRTAPVQIAAQ